MVEQLTRLGVPEYLPRKYRPKGSIRRKGHPLVRLLHATAFVEFEVGMVCKLRPDETLWRVEGLKFPDPERSLRDFVLGFEEIDLPSQVLICQSEINGELALLVLVKEKAARIQ